jgi:hypothetical protein
VTCDRLCSCRAVRVRAHPLARPAVTYTRARALRHWAALKEVAAEGRAGAERLQAWVGGHAAAQRAYAHALLDLNDAAAGLKKGTTRAAALTKGGSAVRSQALV